MKNNDVDILLATYIPSATSNARDYLRVQIRSLIDQDYDGKINILIRDDGSDPEILDELKQLPSTDKRQITIIEDDDGNLGYSKNFERLLEHSTAPYAFFSDQDDEWHKNKITRCVSELTAQEAIHGEDTPIMVHHDYSLCDGNGTTKQKSANKAENLTMKDVNFSQMMFSCHARGFSIGVNRALSEKSRPFPEHIDGHDYHVGVIAAAMGKIAFIPEQLAAYRIHDKNTSQIVLPQHSSRTINQISKTLSQLFNPERTYALFRRVQDKLHQREGYFSEVLQNHGDDPNFNSDFKKTAETFLGMGEHGPIGRLAIMRENGFFPSQPKLQIIAAFNGKATEEEITPHPDGNDVT